MAPQIEKQLLEIAESTMQTDPMVSVLCHAMLGAAMQGPQTEKLLSTHVTDFVRNTLLPMALQGKADQLSKLN